MRASNAPRGVPDTLALPPVAEVVPLLPDAEFASEQPEETSVDTFPLYWDDELEAILDPEPLVEGMLFRDSLATIVAKWESFKSFFALSLAFSVATGLDLFGRRVSPGPVLYIVAEGARGMKRRMAALKAETRFTGRAGVLFLTTSVRLDSPADVARLAREIERLGVRFSLIIVDTVARNMGGKENDAEAMSAFVAGLDRLRTMTGAAVVGVHHTGWSGDHSRGSSALPAALDTEIALERDGDRVTVKCSKQKDAPHFPDFTLEALPCAGSLVLRSVEPRTAKLSENEATLLAEVHRQDDGSGTTYTTLLQRTGLAKGSFSRAVKRLEALAYVRCEGKRYHIKDAGRLALGSMVPGRFHSEVEPRALEVPPVSSSKAGTVEPALEPDDVFSSEDAA